MVVNSGRRNFTGTPKRIPCLLRMNRANGIMPLALQFRWKTPISWVIKTQVKDLMIPRYKLIVIVHIGQLKSQSILIGSRCLWDPKSDTFSSYVFRNSSLFALASVYAVYFEWLKRRNLVLTFFNKKIGHIHIYVHEIFTTQKFEKETTLIFQTTGIFGLFHALLRTEGGKGSTGKTLVYPEEELSLDSARLLFLDMDSYLILLLVLITLIALYGES